MKSIRRLSAVALLLLGAYAAIGAIQDSDKGKPDGSPNKKQATDLSRIPDNSKPQQGAKTAKDAISNSKPMLDLGSLACAPETNCPKEDN